MLWDQITTHFRVSDAGFSVSWMVAAISIGMLWLVTAIKNRSKDRDK